MLETKVERRTRKENKRYEDTTKNKTAEYVRHCQLLEADDILLGHDLRSNLKQLFDRHGVHKRDQDEILNKAKEIKRNFLIELAKAYQHYLPLDVDFLQWLQYVCPKKATEHPEAEKYLLRIAEKLPNYDDVSSDDLKREIRRLRSQNDFGEEL